MRFCRIALSFPINSFELSFPYIPIYDTRIRPLGTRFRVGKFF